MFATTADGVTDCKNSPGNGNGKWQGLWPSVGHARNARLINTRAGGDNRNVVFCMNQLGGVGRISNMFATTADGVTDCKNGKLKWTGPYIPQNLDELLQVADKDGDGMVSKAELNKYFEGYVDADDVDLDNNNEITSNEYQTLLNYLGSKYSEVISCGRPNTKAGDCCNKDSQCISGACGYTWASNEEQTCCESGKTFVPFDFSSRSLKDFCVLELENGQACQYDRQCKSEKCRSNLCWHS